MKNTKNLFFPLTILATSGLLFSSLPSAVSFDSSDHRETNRGGDDVHSTGSSEVGSGEWKVLTKGNFSSQTRLHPYVLVMVTVPWSGESRSLMRAVSRMVNNNQRLFGNLKLMVVYRNFEKILADVLDAAEGLELFFFYHSKSIRYRGRLRAHNILSSVSHILSLQHVEFPLKFLNTGEELESFLQSTDRAILLSEFCGWSAKLLYGAKNETKGKFHGEQLSHHGNPQGTNFTSKANGTPFSWKEIQKGLENEKLTCSVENELNGLHWLRDFFPANRTTPEIESETYNIGTGCTSDKLQQFDSVFTEFNEVARDFSMPVERQRFGVISKRSLLSFLGFEVPEIWTFLMIFPGFPNLSKTLENVNDLRVALQEHHPVIIEVARNQRNQEGAFPLDAPSVILFIDRSSESPNIREESKAAVEVYRQAAVHYGLPKQMLKQSSVGAPSKLSPLGDSMTKDTPASKIVKAKDKRSAMIVKEGGSLLAERVVSDNQNNPAYSILKQLVHREDSTAKTREIRISLLAKEIGFQLLSDDFNVEVIDLQLGDKEGYLLRSDGNGFTRRTGNEIVEHPVDTNANVEYLDSSGVANVAEAAGGRDFELVTVRSVQRIPEPVLHNGENVEDLPIVASDKESAENTIRPPRSSEADTGIMYSEPLVLSPLTSHAESVFHLNQDVDGDESTEKYHVDHVESISNGAYRHEVKHTHQFSSEPHTSTDNLDEQQGFNHIFTGYFFFSDGGYELLRSLTGGSDVPTMVLLDPLIHKHYVMQKEKHFTFDSLLNFIDKSLNGSLSPHGRSEQTVQRPREMPLPPFVNLDFHEADGVPRVTVNTFADVVLGHRCQEKRTPSEWKAYVSTCKRDVLVFFCNNWCGFCQRMELVVREVHRAFKNFKSLSKDPTYKSFLPSQNEKEDACVHDFPSIYYMDCTLNDCGSILRQYGKGDVYPTLILFPAVNKDYITYEGDISVLGIFDFLSKHGRSSYNLHQYKGILWNQEGRGHGSVLSSDVFPDAIHEQTSITEDVYRVLPLHGDIRENNRWQKSAHPLNGLPDERERVIVGSILTATDKLLNAHPFDKSSVLIVKLAENEGFQGLIINKHISWEIFEKSDEDLAPLKQAPLSYGGPVRMHDLPLLSFARQHVDGYSKVSSNIYFGDHLATAVTIERIQTLNASAGDFWFFLGYSSWGRSQLFDELAEGAWQLTSLDTEHFDWPDI